MTPSMTPTPQGGAAQWWGRMMNQPRPQLSPRQPYGMPQASPVAPVAAPSPGGPQLAPGAGNLLRMAAARMMANRGAPWGVPAQGVPAPSAANPGPPPAPISPQAVMSSLFANQQQAAQAASLANARASGLFQNPPTIGPAAPAPGSFWGTAPGTGPTAGFVPPSAPGPSMSGIAPGGPSNATMIAGRTGDPSQDPARAAWQRQRMMAMQRPYGA